MRNKSQLTKKHWKVLFIGLGSVGQRHLQNFKEIAPVNTTIMAYRTSGFNSVVKDGVASSCNSLAEYYNLIEYSNLDRALRQKPDIGFICNPSNLHVKTATRLARRGLHLFIEKPLSTSTLGLSTLESLVKKNSLITIVGYQTHFHPVVSEVKSIIISKRYGEVVSAEFLWHTYLPDHHHYEDYHRGYAARSDLGGGVTFGLSHELDLIQWLFGIPFEVYAIKGAPSKLDVDVEDTVLALFKCSTPVDNYPVSLSISYSQGLEERKFSILMQGGLLECDLRYGTLKVTEHSKRKIFLREYRNVKRNDLFKSEMKHFLACVFMGQETDIPVSEGKKSLIMALAIRKSLKNGKVVKIKYE